MNRFIKTLSLLIISLFFLSASIDATLDRLARSPHGSEISMYGRNGRLIVTYTGDLRELTQQAEQDDQTVLPPGRRAL